MPSLAARRRHPGLIHFEDEDVRAHEADQLGKIDKDRARIRAKRLHLTKEVSAQRRAEWLDRVRRDDMAR